MLGTAISLTLLRELAAVVAALLFAGRAGSALTAEIGSMKQSEQFASMEMIGVDPLRQIVSAFVGRYCQSADVDCDFATIGIIGGKLVGVDFWVLMKVHSGVVCKVQFSSGMTFLMAPLLKYCFCPDLYMGCGLSRLCL